jgi:phage host-nuclease inhibitor protein Gam
MMKRIGELKAENARLEARVEQLSKEQRLKAIPVEAKLLERISELKAEVERLTKAGDLICRMAGNNQVINRHWKTAKKGVQS